MRIPRPVTIDFETLPALGRPEYPPRPVGVSIKFWGKRPKYYAWGHPTKNNCTKAEAIKALRAVWRNPEGLLCQYGKFDVDVAETHMGMPRLKWDKYHDTLFLLFLEDPHSNSLELKPAAERYLGDPPTEQDALADWLVTKQPIPGVKISRATRTEHSFGRYIAYAPGDLVGRYANGDTSRTEGLFRVLWKSIRDRGMLDSYDLDRELMLELLEMERQGVPVDLERLRSDVEFYGSVFERLEGWVRKTLGIPDLNLDSGRALVNALIGVDGIDTGKLGLTPKSGQYKSDKASLKAAITDPALAGVLRYRAQLKTTLNTFMRPWLKTAEASGGLIFTNWNQVRSTEGNYSVGARTGRLSSNPNFQNIPNQFDPIFKGRDKLTRILPPKPFKWALPPLPKVRSYIVPWGDDQVLMDRDYSQQELRILGHFEDGALLETYHEDPWVDLHEHARVEISSLLGREFKRKPIKNTGFGIIYGMGLGLLAEMSGSTVAEAKEVKEAYLSIFPGLRAMYQDMKKRAQVGEPIRTWGGREYYCEEPKWVDGRRRTFDYKLVNQLIQGSAADCTKQAIINYMKIKPAGHRLFLTVHDETLGSAPAKELVLGMEAMKEAMESVEFDLPMLSEGTFSNTNWDSLEPYDEKGVILYGKKS